MKQEVLDQSNAEFWAELCGSSMARAAGITGQEPDDLRRFDELYLDYYPYLARYLPSDFGGDRVLEIGLGYGTLGQAIASRNAEYHGVDISPGPVAMMRKRFEWLGRPKELLLQASALDLPYPDESFDQVYSIGCLHHTGDLRRALGEVYRVLRPGGRAVVMVYNAHSFRRAAVAVRGMLSRKRRQDEEGMRALYDTAESGEAAPHTDFVSKTEAQRLFNDFSRVRIDRQNFDDLPGGIKRKWLLGNVARIAGLDLYIVATK
jgi:ubiquinone/menaquinone biosynthesis C-methylase UbiE